MRLDGLKFNILAGIDIGYQVLPKLAVWPLCGLKMRLRK